MKKLDRFFYEREALLVSKELLGKLLVRSTGESRIVGEIVETEAYIGPEDKASHAYGNKKTKRTFVQFLERGHAYVFRIYGMYCCFCIVVGTPYIPAVTLIRAVRPVEGLDLMRKNRKLATQKNVFELTNGPSKLCQAFRITHSLNGIDLLGDELFICTAKDDDSFQISQSPRIGIDYAEEFKDSPWRFYITDNHFVSKSPWSKKAK